MFPHTSLKLLDTLTMQRRVVVKTLFLAITIRISHGIYIHPENQTPTTSTTSPGGGTISSVLAYPPTTSGSNTNLSSNKHKLSNTTTPLLDYVSEEESAIYYEYETVNQTNVPDATGIENEDEFCSFTLYVSSNSDKNSGRGCKVQSSGESKQQGGKATVVSGGPRSVDLGLRKRLGRVERRLDLLERQLFRQSELLGKLQNQMFGLVKSDEGGLCEFNLGWVRHGNSCYWFGSHHVSWDAARVICQAKGASADLAIPSDESETKVLASYAQYYDPNYSWWLGCSQYEIGDWRCVDGQPLNYTNWRLDRPSNYDNHRCLQLGPPKVDFVDTQCNQKWPFACEKPIRTLNQSS